MCLTPALLLVLWVLLSPPLEENDRQGLVSEDSGREKLYVGAVLIRLKMYNKGKGLQQNCPDLRPSQAELQCFSHVITYKDVWGSVAASTLPSV